MQKQINLKLIDSYVDNDTRFCRELHPNGKLLIYGYDGRKSKNNIVWNKFNKIMRGLIVDLEGNILERPFNKFFTFKNYISENEITCSEGQTIVIPNEPYKILEKADGSMGVLYWADGVPQIATQRSFKNPNAIIASEILHRKYSHTFLNLNKNHSYIFEVISPQTSVLVDYGKEEKIVLLGILDKKTGKELPVTEELGFPVAKNFTKEFENLKTLDALKKLDIPNLEGFVLTYESGLKLKIKFPWYDKAHRIMSEIIMSEELLYNKKLELHEILGIKANKIKYSELDKSSIDFLLNDSLRKIPRSFLQNGFDQWLRNPNRPDEYNVKDTLSKPEDCTFMWKFIKSLKESYT